MVTGNWLKLVTCFFPIPTLKSSSHQTWFNGWQKIGQVGQGVFSGQIFSILGVQIFTCCSLVTTSISTLHLGPVSQAHLGCEWFSDG